MVDGGGFGPNKGQCALQSTMLLTILYSLRRWGEKKEGKNKLCCFLICPQFIFYFLMWTLHFSQICFLSLPACFFQVLNCSPSRACYAALISSLPIPQIAMFQLQVPALFTSCVKIPSCILTGLNSLFTILTYIFLYYYLTCVCVCIWERV